MGQSQEMMETRLAMLLEGEAAAKVWEAGWDQAEADRAAAIDSSGDEVR